MTRYSVFVHEDVLAAIPRSASHHRRLLDFIRSLGDNPHQQGDYTETDDVGRQLEVKIVSRHAVTYWPDHAVKEVKIIHIQPAGK